MFFVPFLCSGIPDLALGILKMLIRIYLRDVLKPTVYWFASGLIWFSTSLYSIYSNFFLFINISYVQENFKLNKINRGWKCFSVLVVFLWLTILLVFRLYKLCTAYFGKKFFVHSVQSGTSVKVFPVT